MFGSLREKNLKNALAHVIGRDFPRIGGDRIRALCAEMILDVVAKHLRSREHLRHGQILWLGVDVNDPPSRGKRRPPRRHIHTQGNRILIQTAITSMKTQIRAIVRKTPEWANQRFRSISRGFAI